jgi:tetratricopeptide (TPR) repeat protein
MTCLTLLPRLALLLVAVAPAAAAAQPTATPPAAAPAPAPAPTPAPSASAPSTPAPSALPATPDETKARARAFVEAGLAAHGRGAYDEAIALYEQAYDLLPHPALFFNMGQAHRLAGRTAEALAMYRRYLAEVPVGPLADQTRVWIAALGRSPSTAPVPSPAPPAAPATGAAPAPRSPPARERSRVWTYAAVATATAGLASAVTAGYFGLRAQRISDELSELNAPYDRGRYREGQRAEDTMFVLYGVGGALIVGGAALYIWAPVRERDSRPVALTPTVAPGQAGVVFSGRF